MPLLWDPWFYHFLPSGIAGKSTIRVALEESPCVTLCLHNKHKQQQQQ